MHLFQLVERIPLDYTSVHWWFLEKGRRMTQPFRSAVLGLRSAGAALSARRALRKFRSNFTRLRKSRKINILAAVTDETL
jgi:hypothetical protein